MTDLQLPLWIVTDGVDQIPPSHSPCDDPAAFHAFTTTDRLTEFLEGRVGGTWKVALVASREALFLAIADAHRAGATTICFDPQPDGSGGEPVDLATVFKYCGELSQSA